MSDLLDIIKRLRVRLGRGSWPAQVRDRRWRTKRRALELRPLSDKVVYPRRLVDVVVVKKGRPK